MQEGRALDLLTLCRQRCSCRSFRPDPVPPDHINRMLEAACAAPSACNRQPWRFAVVAGAEQRRDVLARGLLPGLRMAWLGDAPVLIALGIERSTLTHRLAPLLSRVDYAALDAGIAGEHLVLAASELGLGTCWIGWIRAGGLRRAVRWPRTTTPCALIAVGWPAAEAAGRRTERRPLADLVTWIE
jgi:nitroreductase